MPYVWFLFIMMSGPPASFSNYGSWPDLAQCETLKAEMIKTFPKQVSERNAHCVKYPVTPVR